MVTLYVCSPAPGAGKTALCVALARRLAADGLAIGYEKLVGRRDAVRGDGLDAPDARFVAQALRLRAPGSPGQPANGSSALAGGAPGGAASISRERDLLLVEVGPGLAAGAEPWLGGRGARALVVLPYAPEGLVEAALAAGEVLGGALVGAVATAVPEVGRRSVERVVRPALAARGIDLLGALPLSPALLGVTVGELAAALGGEFLCAESAADRPVEAYMLAAMSDLGANAYFRQPARKAVIASGDKPDVHLAALQTDTACIVLTNGLAPDPTVLALARDQGVPLVQVAMDSTAALEAISDLLPRVRFRQAFKVPVVGQLLAEHFDYPALRRGLGLPEEVRA